jgi:hypothetical protein
MEDTLEDLREAPPQGVITREYATAEPTPLFMEEASKKEALKRCFKGCSKNCSRLMCESTVKRMGTCLCICGFFFVIGLEVLISAHLETPLKEQHELVTFTGAPLKVALDPFYNPWWIQTVSITSGCLSSQLLESPFGITLNVSKDEGEFIHAGVSKFNLSIYPLKALPKDGLVQVAFALGHHRWLEWQHSEYSDTSMLLASFDFNSSSSNAPFHVSFTLDAFQDVLYWGWSTQKQNASQTQQMQVHLNMSGFFFNDHSGCARQVDRPTDQEIGWILPKSIDSLTRSIQDVLPSKINVIILPRVGMIFVVLLFSAISLFLFLLAFIAFWFLFLGKKCQAKFGSKCLSNDTAVEASELVKITQVKNIQQSSYF